MWTIDYKPIPAGTLIGFVPGVYLCYDLNTTNE